MKKLLITAMMLFATIALAACDGNGNTAELATVQEINNPQEEEIVDLVRMDDVASSENDTLVWKVEPTLEYDFIYHCCFFSTGDHDGEFIDSTTGLIIDWSQDLAFGHGPNLGWVYDPAVSLLGFGGVGDYSGMWLLPINEWREEFPNIDEEQGLMIVQAVNSSMRNITEIGNEYLSDDAHSGQFAVMLNGTFITDFIFDGGSIRDVNVGVLNHTIPMRMGSTWGFIDKDGNVAIPFLFEHIVRIDDDSAFARYNGRYGILNIPLTIANFYPARPTQTTTLPITIAPPTLPTQTEERFEPLRPTLAHPNELPTTVTIGGLEVATSETHLILKDMDLTEEDLLPLRYFPQLIYLDLSGNSILDLSQTAIPQMTHLINLDLSNNAIRDEWHRSVEWLSDISELAGLTNLLFLSVASNTIEDISVVAGFTELSSLNIDRNHIVDITPLQELTNLANLYIGLNFIEDLSPIRYLYDNLRALCLNWSRQTDISDVAYLTRLIWLDIANNQQLSDITPLATLTDLQSLNMSGIMVHDLTPLSGLTALEWLNISSNTGSTPVTDLSPLQNLHNLNTLVFFGHGLYVTDWSPVAHVYNIVPPLE